MEIFLKIVALFALVLLNGFFVASEFAIVKIRETRLVELAVGGNLRARVARNVVRQLDAYLSATQLGITIASLGLGWLGEPLVSSQLEPFLHRSGVESEAMVTSISFAVGFAIITFLHIVFGELAPKSLAIRRPEETTLWVAIPLRLFYWTFFPAIWVLNWVAIGTLRLIGITPAKEDELAHSEAELLMILSESARGGHISEQEKIISERALRFADLKARQIMIPRGEVIYFSLADSLEQSLTKAWRNNFARYPLCETDLDSVVGMIHIRDVLWMLQKKGEVDLESVAHEVVVVSEEESLEIVLQKFRSTHIHMALVADEVGVVSGLVTLEDVLEQLVGEIQDEFDRESPLIKKIGELAYEASGRIHLTVLEAKLGIEFGDDDVVTLSGYVTERLGRFPGVGDSIDVGDWRVVVTRAEALKVRTLRLEQIRKEDKEEEG